MDFTGKLIYDKNSNKINEYTYDTEVVWEGFVCEIPEFMEELNKKYNSNNK